MLAIEELIWIAIDIQQQLLMKTNWMVQVSMISPSFTVDAEATAAVFSPGLCDDTIL